MYYSRFWGRYGLLLVGLTLFDMYKESRREKECLNPGQSAALTRERNIRRRELRQRRRALRGQKDQDPFRFIVSK